MLVHHLLSSLCLDDCSVNSHLVQQNTSDLTTDTVLHRYKLESSRNLCTEQSPKESDDTRCCTNTICPPEDEHNIARNM